MEITTLKNFDWKKSRDKKNVLKTVALFDKWLKEDDKRGLKRINEKLKIKNLRSLKCTPQDFKDIQNALSDKQKIAIYEAIKNITYVSKNNFSALVKPVEPLSGIQIWERKVPIESVGSVSYTHLRAHET